MIKSGSLCRTKKQWYMQPHRTTFLIGNTRYVDIPKGSLVIYLESQEGGSHKLLYGEAIGWTMGTEINSLLEEVNLVETG